MPRSPEPALRQVLTVEQMRSAENALIVGGMSVDELMQRAGRGAGEWVRRIAATRPVTVLCGPGNNGGDGWVIAEYLRERGNAVRVVMAREPATPAARKARQAYQGEIIPAGSDMSGAVLVDCLFGSGLSRPLPDDLRATLIALATRHDHRIAIDVPSGIDSDTGAQLNEDLPNWTLTIALGAWKHAHFAMPARAVMGALRLVDIGIAAQGGAAQVLAKPMIDVPPVDSHKYRRGLLGLLAGEMPGAALLAARAAQHAGAGYVKLGSDARLLSVPAELVVAGRAEIIGDQRVAALLIGPGLGRSGESSDQLREALRTARPVVIDADGLMLLRGDMLNGQACILTPHEGEMMALERAFGLASTGLRRDRAMTLAKLSGAVVLLKGPDSLIAAPDGSLVLSSPASSWLSVAGTGDVLAGTIASRLAVHGDPLRAAEEGLWLHSKAAQACGAAFTAGELAGAIRHALEECLP